MIYHSAQTGGFYDSEINSIIPSDAVTVTRAEHQALLNGQSSGKRIVSANGRPVLVDPPAPTLEQRIAGYVSDVQKHMDDTANAYGYDDIKSAVTYADEPSVAKFQEEGRKFRAWRSLVWAHCYAVLDQVQAGGDEPSVESLIAGLPGLDA
jgi:hypothetical protein